MFISNLTPKKIKPLWDVVKMKGSKRDKFFLLEEREEEFIKFAKKKAKLRMGKKKHKRGNKKEIRNIKWQSELIRKMINIR